MGHAHGLSIEEQRKADKKVGFVGFWILLIVTFGEVGVALLGKKMGVPPTILRLVMIGLSLFKAYYIVSIFMHLGHEARAMGMTIVLPMLLLVWAIISFLWEGESVRHNRNYVNDGDPLKEKVEHTKDATGMNDYRDMPKSISFR
jgi:cytochrome c oxidase subunit 4